MHFKRFLFQSNIIKITKFIICHLNDFLIKSKTDFNKIFWVYNYSLPFKNLAHNYKWKRSMTGGYVMYLSTSQMIYLRVHNRTQDLIY